MQALRQFIAQISPGSDYPRLVGDLISRVGLGNAGFAVRDVLALAGAGVVVLDNQPLAQVALPSLSRVSIPLCQPPTRNGTCTFELLCTVVCKILDCHTGQLGHPDLPQQSRHMPSQQFCQKMWHPCVVLSHVVAQHMTRVGPYVSASSYDHRAGEVSGSVVVPMLGLKFNLLEHGDMDNRSWKSTTTTTSLSTRVPFRSLKTTRWDIYCRRCCTKGLRMFSKSTKNSWTVPLISAGACTSTNKAIGGVMTSMPSFRCALFARCVGQTTQLYIPIACAAQCICFNDHTKHVTYVLLLEQNSRSEIQQRKYAVGK